MAQRGGVKDLKRWISEEEVELLRKFARYLRYFVEERIYSYIDRISNAITPDVAVYAIKDAVRALRSAHEKDPSVKVPAERDVQEVIKIVQKSPILATSTIASIAMAFYPGEGKEEEVKKEESKEVS